MSAFMLRKLDERMADQMKIYYLYSSLDIYFLFPFSYFNYRRYNGYSYHLTEALFAAPTRSRPRWLNTFRLRSQNGAHFRCSTCCAQTDKCSSTPADLKYLIPLLNRINWKTENTVGIVIDLRVWTSCHVGVLALQSRRLFQLIFNTIRQSI